MCFGLTFFILILWSGFPTPKVITFLPKSIHILITHQIIWIGGKAGRFYGALQWPIELSISSGSCYMVRSKQRIIYLIRTWGSNRYCALCDSKTETAGHLFHCCVKVQPVWALISNHLSFNSHNGFTYSNRLWSIGIKGSIHLKSIIAITTWLIWKTHCNYIFRVDIFYCNLIVKQVIAHIKQYSYSSNSYIGKNFFVTNFTNQDGPFLLQLLLGMKSWEKR